MMRVLFVTGEPPSRRSARALGFVRELARVRRVTVVSVCRSAGERRALGELEALGVETRAVSAAQADAQWRVALADAAEAGEMLRVVGDATTLRLRAEVRAEVARGDVAVIHAEGARAASAAVGLAAPVVWDVGEGVDGGMGLGAQEWAVLRACAQVVAPTELRRLALAHDAGEWEKAGAGWEIGKAGGDDGTLRLVGRYEAAGPAVTVIEQGVEVVEGRWEPERRRAAEVCWQVTPMGWSGAEEEVRALREEAMRLLEAVAPRLWAARPEVELTITGLEALAGFAGERRIRFVGPLEDARPYVAEATVVIEPRGTLLAGARQALLEALALGAPVVAMDGAALGLRVAPGRDALVASSLERLVALTLRLLDDEPLRGALGYNGRRAVEERHTWRRLTRRLEGVYRAAAGARWDATAMGSVTAEVGRLTLGGEEDATEAGRGAAVVLPFRLRARDA